MPNQAQATAARIIAGEHREGDAVLGTGVAGQQHRQQHDDVGQGDGEHRLLPVHAERDEPGGEQPGGDVVGHADPQGGEVVGGPPAAGDRHGQQVVVDETVVREGGARREFDASRRVRYRFF
jgi:hypothetical protein